MVSSGHHGVQVTLGFFCSDERCAPNSRFDTHLNEPSTRVHSSMLSGSRWHSGRTTRRSTAMVRQSVPLKKSADGQMEKAGAPTRNKTRWTARSAMGTLVVVIVSISAPFAHPLLVTAATASRSPVSMPWPRSYHFLKRIRDQA